MADVDEIWLYLRKKASPETADRIVRELWVTFEKAAASPRTGHRRPDLTRHEVLFLRVDSYLIVYSPDHEPLHVLAVLHGKRNVGKILNQRS